MNCALELHDSKITAVVRTGDVMKIELLAYVHESPGVPGVDPGEVYQQRAELVLEGVPESAHVETDLHELYDGAVTCDGDRFSNGVPLPFDKAGTIVVHLEGWMQSGASGTLDAEGTHITVRVFGDRRHSDSFPGMTTP
jgi:hypothetical protein